MPYKNLVLIYWPSQFQEWTFSFALKNVAAILGLTYHEFRYNPGECGLNKYIPADNSIVFFVYDTQRNFREFAHTKETLPNSALIELGADNHYYGLHTDCLPLIDLHINTMFALKSPIEAHTKFAHFYWSISETLINHIEALKNSWAKSANLPQKSFDLMCLMNVVTHERTKLYDAIKGAGYSIKCNLREKSLDRILEYYAQSHFTLGTSSPCANDFKGRSMKGFRDWIGPFLDSVLIYDDVPEFQHLQNMVLPTYIYGDNQSLFTLIEALKTDPVACHEFLMKQRAWALENTLENQFLQILKTHIL